MTTHQTEIAIIGAGVVGHAIAERVLAEGRVIFSGLPDEVRASPLVREVYLGGEG